MSKKAQGIGGVYQAKVTAYAEAQKCERAWHVLAQPSFVMDEETEPQKR